MKTRKKNRHPVRIVTLGCSKNVVDSEVLFSQLAGGDLAVSHEHDPGPEGTVVINTCGFIDHAKQESIDTILHYAREKGQGRIGKLYVTGCLSERFMPELEKEIPDVDQYFGTHDLVRLLATLGCDYRHELVGERTTSTPAHYAYLKISEGCDRPCSFCAIPLMRGRHVSKPMEQLVTEAGRLAAKGARELLIIAQDSTYYGLDLYKSRQLAQLLERLARVDGIDWIRLHYAYPSGFPEDVLEVIRDHAAVCRYIDMPLQHINDRVLASMRRGIGGHRTRELVERIRTRIPEVVLRTTLITGYPGETEAEHRELVEFVRQARFERLGAFTYSHEEQTHAASLADDVPAEAKEERKAEIMAVQQENSRSFNDAMVGRELKVLVDRKEGDFFVGRTEFDSPEVDNEVLIDAADSYLRIGDFSRVRIESAEDFDLIGVPSGRVPVSADE